MFCAMSISAIRVLPLPGQLYPIFPYDPYSADRDA